MCLSFRNGNPNGHNALQGDSCVRQSEINSVSTADREGKRRPAGVNFGALDERNNANNRAKALIYETKLAA